MDRAVTSLLGPNALIGQQRYMMATTTVPGRDDDVTLKIGEGGLMRDPLMVALFRVVFFTLDDPWAAAGRRLKVRNLNNCWRGTRGRELGSTSLCQHYADDTSKQIVAEQGEDVVALARRVQCYQ